MQQKILAKLMTVVLLAILTGGIAYPSVSQVKAQTQQSPAAALSPLSAKIAAATNHTCAVTSGGGLRCWGGYGAQLGAGQDDRGSATPRLVTSLPSSVQAVVTGRSHTCALVNGAVKCWGDNTEGQVGNGTFTTQFTPVGVSGLDHGVVAIAAGLFHTCALTEQGTVLCWGNNFDGQLGDNSTENRATPVAVVNLAAGVMAIAAGGYSTCAVTTPGNVVCWGDNYFGNLGDGSTDDRWTPTAVSGSLATVISVAVGLYHSCAQMQDGTVYCWGLNDDGQLGTGDFTTRLAPADSVKLSGSATAISAGELHTCAVVNGGAKCWGANTHGMLGDGSRKKQNAPVDVSGASQAVGAVAAGRHHTCAMLTTSQVYCWGANDRGQIGNGEAANLKPPMAVVDVGAPVISLAGGEFHSCALLASGIKCWGDNEYGQVGINSPMNHFAPIPFPWLSNNVKAVVAGAEHTCALTESNGVVCWGANWVGQLGNNSEQDHVTPQPVANLQQDVRAIATHGNHTCALLTTDKVQCWGTNRYGQLGNGDTEIHLIPVEVRNLNFAIKQVAPGYFHTCALSNDGAIYCWGDAWWGQLGNGTTSDSLTPVRVLNLNNAQAVASGDHHSCALTSTGAVHCWGSNEQHQLGSGTENSTVPQVVPGLLSGIQAIAAGNAHTCALQSNGVVQCWGDNRHGQLGDGSTTAHATPITVPTLSNVTAIEAGGEHTCALLQSGAVQCWGWAAQGQLGDNDPRYLTPVAILDPAFPPATSTPTATTTPPPTTTPTPPATPIPTTPAVPVSQTLVLIYAGLDNNLGQGDTGAVLLNTLQKGMHDGIALRLMIDGPRLGDSYLYTFTRHNAGQCLTPSDVSCPSRRQTWTEDTAHPQSLQQFVYEGLRAYPNASNVILVLMGHGSGWSANFLSAQPTRWKQQDQRLGGMLWDDHPDAENSAAGARSLSTRFLGEALKDATAMAGRPIDLLYLDACSMAMAEVAFEVRESTRYLLASPNIKWAAFPYDRLLQQVSSDRDGAALGAAWLQVEAETLRPLHYPFTFALVDLAQMGNVLRATDQLAAALTTALPSQRAQIAAANQASDRFESDYDQALSPLDSYIDLNHFATTLSKRFAADSPVTLAAQSLQLTLTTTIVTQTFLSGQPWSHPDQTWAWQMMSGLSIYFPDQLSTIDQAKRFHYIDNNLAWAKEGQWDEFLLAYQRSGGLPGQAGVELPTCDISTACSQMAQQLPQEKQVFLPLIIEN